LKACVSVLLLGKGFLSRRILVSIEQLLNLLDKLEVLKDFSHHWLGRFLISLTERIYTVLKLWEKMGQ